MMGTEKTRTISWHPQSDGMIDRLNRSLEMLLRQNITEDQNNFGPTDPNVLYGI